MNAMTHQSKSSHPVRIGKCLIVSILLLIQSTGISCVRPSASPGAADVSRTAPSAPATHVGDNKYDQLDSLFGALMFNAYLEVYEAAFSDVARIHASNVGTVLVLPASDLEFSYSFTSQAWFNGCLIDTNREWMWTGLVPRSSIQDWVDQAKGDYDSHPTMRSISFNDWLRAWTAYQTYFSYLDCLREGYLKGWPNQPGLEDAVKHMHSVWPIEMSSGLDEGLQMDYEYPKGKGTLVFKFLYKGTEVHSADIQFLNTNGAEVSTHPFKGSMTF